MKWVLIGIVITLAVLGGLADPYLEPSAYHDGAHLSWSGVLLLFLALRLDWWAITRRHKK